MSFFLTYKAIYFSIILLVNQYIVYSLYDAKEFFLKKLEDICDYISSNYKDPNDESEIGLYCLSKLEPRIFMEIQTQAVVYQSVYYNPVAAPNWKHIQSFLKEEDYVQPIVLSQYAIKNSVKEPMDLLDITLLLSVHLENYNYFSNYKPSIKRAKKIIFSLYLFIWSYVFLYCLSAFDLVEPFSNTFLNS